MTLAPILAALIQLAPGANPGVAGEVLAIRAATTNAAATVKVSAVASVTEYTNATAQVISYETAYAVTYTNFDGNASVSTNVMGYLDYDAFKTNGTSKIVGTPTRFDMPITNTVVTASLPKATYSETNEVGAVTTSAHFGSVTANGVYLTGESLLVTGAGEGDAIYLLIK